MAIATKYGSVTIDTSLVPYIRERDVDFVARNLRPYKIATLFFDEVAINGYCQVGNKITVDSKKVVNISPNNTITIDAGSIAYQGTSNTVNTFSAIVDDWHVSNSTVILKTITGNFDDMAQLYFENVSTHLTYSNSNVVSVTNYQTSDIFEKDEGVIDPSAGNAYARVISTSGENILYVDQNYININVSKVGANTLSNTEYSVGDIVFQTSDGSSVFSENNIVFKGYVAYYQKVNDDAGSIAISPITGSAVVSLADASSNAKVRIWNASNKAAKPLGASDFIKNTFAAGHNVKSVVTSTKTVKISSYDHRSGLLANTSRPNSNTVILTANTSTNTCNGNLIYFTSGSGIGMIKRIIAVNGEIAVLNSELSFAYTSNSHYSLGNFIVDDHGTTAGIFHIPETTTLRFKTGERLFTITDTNTYNDPDYGMRATHRYSASAILNTKQNIQMTPIIAPIPETEADSPVAPIDPSQRTFNSDASKSPVTGSTSSTIPRIPLGDGMAQTFFTPKPASNKQDYGMFVSSIDLFFKEKPSIAAGSMQLPITVKIADVVNGYPTKNYLAAKTLQAKDIKVSDLPSTSNANTVTKFTFDDPVYLQPNHEYAIIIGTDSPDYSVYTAVIGDDVLGSNPTRRISEQPYAGSFFRSQNSSTWTPYQDEDLMFVINKAVFTESGSATFNMEDAPVGFMMVDKVSLISSDLSFPNANLTYELMKPYFSNKEYDNGNYVTPYGMLEYGSLFDKSNKSGILGNRRVIRPGNSNSALLTVEMFTSDADISPILNTERLAIKFFQYNINNAGISNNDIAITNAGAGYTAVAANTIVGSSNATMNNYAQLYRIQHLSVNGTPNANIGFYNITISGGEGSGAAGFAVANTDGKNMINYIVMTGAGSGYLETPSISIAAPSATTNVQAYAVINGETDKSGGNITSKYITREIVLEDGFESGDLDVFMDAIRVTGTDIQVYYKVVSADDPDTLNDKSWKRMEKEKNIYSKDYNSKVMLHFKPSFTTNQISYTENGVNYPINHMFKSFAIKVCLLSTDGAVVPKLDNLRISATPAG